MALEVSFRNVELTEEERDELKQRSTRKFAKVSRYLKDPIEAYLVLHQEKHRHVAELQVHAAGDRYFGAKVDTNDWVSAVDGIMNKLARTVRRHKERGSKKRRGNNVEVEAFVADLSQDFQLWTEEAPRAQP